MKEVYKGLPISVPALQRKLKKQQERGLMAFLLIPMFADGMLLGMLAFEPHHVEDTPSNRRQTPHMI